MEAPKKEIGQIIKRSGLSGDYLNEFTPIINFLTNGEEDYAGWARWTIENPIKKYRERYAEENYSNVVTEKNFQVIRNLDNIVELLNLIAQKNNPSDKDRVLRLLSIINELIYDP